MGTRIGALALVISLGMGLLVLPASGAPAPRPALEVIASFDRDTYHVGETARLTVLLTNFGLTELTVTARCEPSPNGLRGGSGWGPLADGTGLVIPAGAARTVAVSEQIPEAAPRFGYVSLDSCSFTAPGYRFGVPATARAKVPGELGSGRGRIFQDGDGDNEVDDGEALAGVTVVVTEPDTGVVVARPVTDARGGFAVDGVPATVYSVRVPGPWTARLDSPGWFELPVVAGESAERAFAVVPGPEAENNRPNLVVSGSFDQKAYTSGDEVRVTVTIANVGEVAADGVRGGAGGKGPMLHYDGDPFAEFFKDGPGVRIEAGAVRRFDIVGSVDDPSGGGVVFAAWFGAANGELSDANNSFRIAAPVTVTRGVFAGTLYGDRNDNNVLDSGEELGRASLQLYGDGDRGEHRQQTDANGRFAFQDLPSGRYQVIYRIPGGWVLPAQYVMVDGAEQSAVLVKAMRPVSETLSASIAFTKDTYAGGEVARLVVRLTNTGGKALNGITATCADDLSAGEEISSDGPGWGELAENGAGATVGQGETRTFSVSSVVPETAFNSGYVLANCRFGNGPLTIPDSRATARAMAKVPGGMGSGEGLLIYDKNSDEQYEGEGVAGTGVAIVDPMTGTTVASATTDGDGHFLFKDVPANRYEFRVTGPWKLREDNIFDVHHGQTDWGVKFVVPGPIPPDPNAPPPPQPQGGVAPAQQLAKTGADVIGLSIWGFAALVAGLALLFVRRRAEAGS